MNKYKKLILSLTIALLPFAGVWAMAKPIPQIKTYHQLSEFANKYPANDFLTNKQIFGANKEGLLEVLLNAYNNLTGQAKFLAGRFLQAKFKLSPTQLSHKLEQIDISKIIPISLAQAQEIIRNMNKEKASLQGEVRQLESSIKTLEAGVGSYRGNTKDLEKIQKLYDNAQLYINALRDDLFHYSTDRDVLEAEIADLKAKHAPKAQIDAVQKSLDDAKQEIAKNQQAEVKANKQIKDLEAKIDDLYKKNPAIAAQDLLHEYDAMLKDVDEEIKKFEKEAGELDKKKNSTSLKELEQLSIDALTDHESLKNTINDFEPQIDDLHKRWNKLVDKSKQGELDQKSKLLLAKGAKIDALLARFTKLQDDANAKQKALFDEAKKKSEAAKAKEQAFIKEIDEWVTKLPNPATDVAKLNAIKPEGLDEQGLDQAELEAQGIALKYKPYIVEFNQLKGKAANIAPALFKLKAADHHILEIQQVIHQAEGVASKAADAKKHGGVKPPPPPPPGAKKVTDVEFVKAPYKLSFKVGGDKFLIEKGNKQSISDFAQNISKLNNEILQKAGEDIVALITSGGSADEQRKAFEAVFAQVIYAPYDEAEEHGNQKAMDSIKELIKPIFKAYPDKSNTIYTNNLEKYDLQKEDIA